MRGPFANRKASPPPDDYAPPADPAACPRCGGVLADPEGIGFCAACGYCRSLEEGRTAAALAAPPPPKPRPKPTALGASEFFRLLALAPTWIWILTCAALAVLPIDFVLDRRLKPDSPGRAFWGLGQAGVGLMLFGVGQAWALSMLRARREPFGPADMLAPFRLWVQAGRWLPDTRWPFALAASGAAAALAAVLWVGGFGYWLRTDPEGDAAVLARQERERFKNQERDQLRQEVSRVTGKAGDAAVVPAGKPPARPDDEDARQVEECVVLGYVPDRTGGVAALLVGTLRDGRLVYAGRVEKGIRPEDSAALLKRFNGLARDTPLLPELRMSARWVEPKIYCEVHTSSAPGGPLLGPSFKGVVD